MDTLTDILTSVFVSKKNRKSKKVQETIETTTVQQEPTQQEATQQEPTQQEPTQQEIGRAHV